MLIIHLRRDPLNSMSETHLQGAIMNLSKSTWLFVTFFISQLSLASPCITQVPEEGLKVFGQPFQVPFIKRNVETFNIIGKADLKLLNAKLSEAGKAYKARALFEGSDQGLVGLFFSKVSGSSHDPYDNYYEYSLMIFGAEKENLFYGLRFELDDPHQVATEAGVEFWGLPKKSNSGGIRFENLGNGVKFSVVDRDNQQLMFEAQCQDCKIYKTKEDVTACQKDGAADESCHLKVEERVSTIVTPGHHWKRPAEKLCTSKSDWYLMGETQKASVKPGINDFKYYSGTDLGDWFTKVRFEALFFTRGQFKMKGDLSKPTTSSDFISKD